MNSRAPLFLISMALAACITVDGDLQRFVSNADLCEHFAGEWDSDLNTADKQQIEYSIDIYCGHAKKQLDVLSEKYKDNPKVMEKLKTYETVKSFRH